MRRKLAWECRSDKAWEESFRRRRSEGIWEKKKKKRKTRKYGARVSERRANQQNTIVQWWWLWCQAAVPDDDNLLAGQHRFFFFLLLPSHCATCRRAACESTSAASDRRFQFFLLWVLLSSAPPLLLAIKVPFFWRCCFFSQLGLVILGFRLRSPSVPTCKWMVLSADRFASPSASRWLLYDLEKCPTSVTGDPEKPKQGDLTLGFSYLDLWELGQLQFFWWMFSCRTWILDCCCVKFVFNPLVKQRC